MPFLWKLEYHFFSRKKFSNIFVLGWKLFHRMNLLNFSYFSSFASAKTLHRYHSTFFHISECFSYHIWSWRENILHFRPCFQLLILMRGIKIQSISKVFKQKKTNHEFRFRIQKTCQNTNTQNKRTDWIFLKVK